MVREIEISSDAYNLLKKMRLSGEDINDTIIRLIKLRERSEFFKRRKQITKDDEFLPLDQSGE